MSRARHAAYTNIVYYNGCHNKRDCRHVITSLLEQCKIFLLSVCLSVTTLGYPKNHTDGLTSPNLCILTVVAARSSFDGVAIRYILPVLWMTSYLHTIGPTARHVYVFRLEVTTEH